MQFLCFTIALTLYVNEHKSFRQWQKTLMVIGITLLAFPADWSSIAVIVMANIAITFNWFPLNLFCILSFLSFHI